MLFGIRPAAGNGGDEPEFHKHLVAGIACTLARGITQR